MRETKVWFEEEIYWFERITEEIIAEETVLRVSNGKEMAGRLDGWTDREINRCVTRETNI